MAEFLSSHRGVGNLFGAGQKKPVTENRIWNFASFPGGEKDAVMKQVSPHGPFEFYTAKCGHKKNLLHQRGYLYVKGRWEASAIKVSVRGRKRSPP